MKSDFKQGRSGVAFKNGKLYEFTDRHVLVMTGGHDPRSWFKRRSHGWKATRKWADNLFTSRVFHRIPEVEPEVEPPDEPPEKRVRLLPSGQYLMSGILCSGLTSRHDWMVAMVRRENAALDAYRATIPAPILAELEGYRDRRWHLYNLLVRCPGALDLSRSNPALAYALASSWVFHKPVPTKPLRAARRLVNRKQKVILDWLGFPATEPARRLLAKIEPGALSVPFLLWMRKALAEPERVQAIRHINRINRPLAVLLMARKLERYLTPRLLEEVSQLRDGQGGEPPLDVAQLMFDTLRMADEEGRGQHCPDRFHSVGRLREVHDELVRQCNRKLLRRGLGGPDARAGGGSSLTFPKPPFVGTPDIRPLVTADDLDMEGLVMSNCVSIYRDSVVQGYYYIYRVLRPIRATLSVRRGGFGWEVGELEMEGHARLPEPQQQQIFDELMRSGEYVSGPGFTSSSRSVANANPAPPDSVVLRCDLNLEEGQRAPPQWNERNPRQLPLLSPAEREIIKMTLDFFNREARKDR